MATNALECGICNQEFNDREHRPRILPCTHSLCSFCLNQLIIAYNKRCPFCREDFRATTAEDLLFNRSVLDIATQVSDQGISYKQGDNAKVTYASLQKDFIADTEKKLADCRRRKDSLQGVIESNKTLEDGLLQVNKDVRSNITRYLGDREKEGRTFLAALNRNRLIMQKQCESLLEEEHQLIDTCNKLSEATNFTSASSHMDKAAEISETLKEMTRRENGIISWNEKSTRRILKVQFEAERIAGLFRDAIETNGDDGLYLTANNLARMSPSLKGMIESGMLLAFQDQEGTRRFAPLRLESGNKLCLFHLKEEEHLPQDAQLIKHDHILELLNSRPCRTFLELENNETAIGRLVIKLDPDGFYPKNFLHMCAGTAGPSFASTKILGVKDKSKQGERVLIGKDLAERAAVSGVDWNQEWMKEIYQRSISTRKVGLGRVWNGPGIAHLSKFSVVTKDERLTKTSRPCFGKVEEGLDVLTNAISQCADVTQIRVINSGIIVSL